MGKILTVSVAAYNVEKFIKKTLDSILQSDVLDAIEVLIIDDGGNDDSIKIAQNYALRHPGTFIPVHKENGGWGSTVNYAINHASGKYFKILDGDDWFQSENLTRFIGLLKTIDADIVYTPYTLVDSETESVISTVGKVDDTYCGKTMQISEAAQIFDFSMHNMTVKSEILRKNHICLLEHCFYTDTEFFIKALSNSNVVYMDVKALYCYRVGREGQSVSLTGLKKHFSEWEKVSTTILEYYRKLSTDKKEIVKASVNKYIISFGYSAYLRLDNLDGMRKFDTMINRCYPELYNTEIKKIRLLRWTGFSKITFQFFRKRELSRG